MDKIKTHNEIFERRAVAQSPPLQILSEYYSRKKISRNLKKLKETKPFGNVGKYSNHVHKRNINGSRLPPNKEHKHNNSDL